MGAIVCFFITLEIFGSLNVLNFGSDTALFWFLFKEMKLKSVFSQDFHLKIYTFWPFGFFFWVYRKEVLKHHKLFILYVVNGLNVLFAF